MNRLFATVGLCLAVSACVSPPPPRTVAQDAAIKKVILLSLVDESATIQNMGFIVFNNDEAHLPRDAFLNRNPIETMQRHVREVRPQWEILEPDPDSISSTRRWNGKFWPWKDSSDKALPEFTELMRRASADAALIFHAASLDQFPGSGVGVRIRFLPGVTPRVTAFASVRLSLVDRKGSALGSWQSAQLATIPAEPSNITSDIKSTENPLARKALTEAMHDQETKALDKLLQESGL